MATSSGLPSIIGECAVEDSRKATFGLVNDFAIFLGSDDGNISDLEKASQEQQLHRVQETQQDLNNSDHEVMEKMAQMVVMTAFLDSKKNQESLTKAEGLMVEQCEKVVLQNRTTDSARRLVPKRPSMTVKGENEKNNKYHNRADRPSTFYPKRRDSLKVLEAKYTNAVDEWLAGDPAPSTSQEQQPFEEYVKQKRESYFDIDARTMAASFSLKRGSIVPDSKNNEEKNDDSEEQEDEEKEAQEEEENVLNCPIEADKFEERIKSLRPGRDMFFDVVKITNFTANREDFKAIHANSHATAVSNYLQSSRTEGVYPEPIIIFRKDEALRQSEMNLSHFGLGDKKLVDTAGAAFQTLDMKSIKIKGNRLSDQGGKNLINQLAKAGGIHTNLDLSENYLSRQSCESLGKAISVSPMWLQRLDLSRNKVDAQGVRFLGESIRNECTLKSLDLSYNNIGANGSIFIADMLAENSSLHQLSLSWCNLTADGAAMVIRAIHGNNQSALISLDLSNNSLGHMSSTKTKNEFVTAICDLLQDQRDQQQGAQHNQNQNLVHLNLSNNVLNKQACEAISEALSSNHSMLGLHMDGNAAFVDPLGWIIPLDNIPSNTNGQDINETFKTMLERTKPLSPEARHKIIANEWTQCPSCWICSGWVQRKFFISARSDDKVLLHTSFDYPMWSGTRMHVALSMDSKEHSEYEDASKVSKIMARSLQIEKKAFVMQEFCCYRVCPPGEVAFFFSVNGKPVLSDLEEQVEWQSTTLCRRPEIVPPTFLLRPRQQNEVEEYLENIGEVPAAHAILNLVTIEARQSMNDFGSLHQQQVNSCNDFPDDDDDDDDDDDSGGDDGHDDNIEKTNSHMSSTNGSQGDGQTAIPHRPPSGNKRKGSSTWHFRRLSEMSSFTKLVELRKKNGHNVRDVIGDFDPWQMVSNTSGNLFCKACPPRSIKMKVDLMEELLKEQEEQHKVGDEAFFNSPENCEVYEQQLFEKISSRHSRSHLDEVFNIEWEASETDVIIISRMEQIKTRAVFKENYEMVVSIFAYYAALNSHDKDPLSGLTVSLTSFFSLCRDACIPCSESTLQDIFEATLSSQNRRKESYSLGREDSFLSYNREPTQGSIDAELPIEEDGLTRSKFMELLVRLGNAIFAEEDPRESETTTNLFNQHLLLTAKAFDVRGYNENAIYHEAMRSILIRNVPMLLRMFVRYSGRFMGKLETPWISLPEFVNIFKDSGLLVERSRLLSFRMENRASTSMSFRKRNSKYRRQTTFESMQSDESFAPLSRRIVAMIFAAAVPVIPQDIPNQMQFYKMDFIDFLAAIGSISAYVMDEHSLGQYTVTAKKLNATLKHSKSLQRTIHTNQRITNSIRYVLRKSSVLAPLPNLAPIQTPGQLPEQQE